MLPIAFFPDRHLKLNSLIFFYRSKQFTDYIYTDIYCKLSKCIGQTPCSYEHYLVSDKDIPNIHRVPVTSRGGLPVQKPWIYLCAFSSSMNRPYNYGLTLTHVQRAESCHFLDRRRTQSTPTYVTTQWIIASSPELSHLHNSVHHSTASPRAPVHSILHPAYIHRATAVCHHLEWPAETHHIHSIWLRCRAQHHAHSLVMCQRNGFETRYRLSCVQTIGITVSRGGRLAGVVLVNGYTWLACFGGVYLCTQLHLRVWWALQYWEYNLRNRGRFITTTVSPFMTKLRFLHYQIQPTATPPAAFSRLRDTNRHTIVSALSSSISGALAWPKWKKAQFIRPSRILICQIWFCYAFCIYLL